MKFKILASPLFAVAIFLSGCNSNEVDRLKAENDSLRRELETRYSVVVTMRDIKGLIDSIDQSRSVLHVNLKEGSTFDDVTSRLTSINKYVKETESKITKIEGELNASKSDASAYMMMVGALKDELHIRVSEIENLEQQISNYKEENKGLVKTVKLQETELIELRHDITAKKEEISLIEAKVNELVDNFKVSEAEALYARAQAVEEAARRTKLAPMKKKETYKEALELYSKALSLGKTEAKAKVDELQKKL